MQNSNVLITGGAGFIGSHITDEIVNRGHNVVVVDNISVPNSGYRNSKAKYIKMDILQKEFESVFLENNIDYCIHLAAQASVTKSISNPSNDANINILGSIKLFELCKKYNCKKILVASSAAVYGNPKYLPIDEKHPTEPMSPYGLSKLAMEKYIQMSDVPFIIFRFSNVYGERQSSGGEAGVIAIFNDAMKNRKEVFIDGDGKQSRDFIYVKDVAKIVADVAFANIQNEIFNISTNTACSINELFENLARVRNYKLQAKHSPARIGDIRNSILENSKLLNRIDIPSFITLQDGLQQLRSH